MRTHDPNYPSGYNCVQIPDKGHSLGIMDESIGQIDGVVSAKGTATQPDTHDGLMASPL